MTHPLHRTITLPLLAVTLAVLYPSVALADFGPQGDAPPAALLFQPNVEFNRQDPADFPLRLLLVGDIPAPLDVAVLEDALEYAATVWTAVGCSTVEVVYAGRAQELEARMASDVDVAVDATFFGDQNKDDFAIAAPYQAGGGFIRINPDKLLTRFPDPMFWRGDGLTSIPDVAMARAVLTHEVGHVLALQHPGQGPTPPGSARPLSTMNGVYATDGGQATLSADDRAALCALYPNDTPETCSSDAECVLALGAAGATCVTLDLASECATGGSACDGIEGTVTVCEEPRTPFGARCFVEHDTCPEVCLYDDLGRGQGLCTRRCEDDSVCPEGFGCRVTSSADIDPPVTHCLPTAPGSLGARGCGCASAAPRTPRPPWWVCFGMLMGLGVSRRRATSSA